MLLLMWGISDLPAQDEAGTEMQAAASEVEPAPLPNDPEAALHEATATIRDLLAVFYGTLPKLLIAFLLLGIAWLLSRVFHVVVRRVLHGWERAEAVAALGRIVLYLLAVSVALTVIAGDARALVGSVGLVGLALSWALQTPIESFTGWVLNAFRGYYRLGDRIEVGDVFGDVYRIDLLTTTVWEAGGPGKPVAGAQPTGALITFPNWEVLRSNIVNYTRDFPYVWDEITVGVANESDLRHTIQVFERVAKEVVGKSMQEPAAKYRAILERARLAFEVAAEPKVFLSTEETWTNCTIRYIVPVRERRRWSTELIIAIAAESSRPEHQGRIVNAYPRSQVELWRSGTLPGGSTGERRP